MFPCKLFNLTHISRTQCRLTHSMLDKVSADDILKYMYFLTALWHFMQIVSWQIMWVKCQSIFLGKYFKMSSAEFTQVKVRPSHNQRKSWAESHIQLSPRPYSDNKRTYRESLSPWDEVDPLSEGVGGVEPVVGRGLKPFW